MKTCVRLQKIKALDKYINSQMNQLEKLRSQALKVNASLPQADRVQNGSRKSRDDLLVELISAQDEIEEYLAKAIKEKREFQRKIAEIPDGTSRALLQMVYIEQLDIDTICRKFDDISVPTYYVWLRKAEKFLNEE
ncbi:MAG: DUF1492 domain-containing protein [Streptococcus lutetiensis]|jgi:DNA-directed RNA polymerase specialized sigma24 family protein|nr:DUF1492 domain-containing protein [Streptococcus lutetiensis]MBD8955890.1 DUF1492 domain-containing protein [Streptococcus lutetiensis]